MFDGLSHLFHHHKHHEPDKSEWKPEQAEHFNDVVQAQKQVLYEMRSMIRHELSSSVHPRFNPDRDYTLNFRVPGQLENGMMVIRDLHKSELEALLKKIDAMERGEQVDILPRENAVLNEIANAIEREELVIEQDHQFISNKESAVYNGLIHQTVVRYKADHISQQKILGRRNSLEGEIVLGDYAERENLLPMYDVDGVKAEDFGQQAYGKTKIFGAEEFEDHREDMDISEDEVSQIEEEREEYSDDFKEAQERFIVLYTDLGNSLKQQYEITSRNLENESASEKARKKDSPDAEKRSDTTAEKEVIKIRQEQTALDIKRASKNLFRKEERKADREARIERDKLKRLEEELDKNTRKIEEGQKLYDRRHENDPPKKAV